MTIVIVFVAVFQLNLSNAVAGDDYVPWSLRDHYSFKGEHAAFHYDVQSAEWKVDVTRLGTVVSDAQAEIELADGRVIRLSSLEPTNEDREAFANGMGKGTYFRTYFTTEDGLKIRYSVARFSERPFLTLHVEATNRGTAPIAIAAIRPAVFPAGSISNLNRNTKVTQLSTERHGAYPVVSDGGRASLVRFAVDTPAVTLGIGVMQSGSMNSYVDLRADGVNWSGSATCVFDPPMVVEPNETIVSDPVWLSFSMGAPEQVHQYHAWSESSAAPRVVSEKGHSWKVSMSGWVTVEDDASAEALYAAATSWRTSDLRHALVPPQWEAQPGALVGDNLDYPSDMSEVAAALTELGMTPGISADPLLTRRGGKDWTHALDGGAYWVDPRTTKGHAYGIRRLTEMKNWGFGFMVVRRARIPDTVLRELNLTRDEADRLTLEMAREAWGERFVLPESSQTLAADSAQWQRAAYATRWYEGYDVVVGPVRLTLAGVESFTPEVANAMLSFGGPIEVIGTPTRKAKRQMTTIFAEHRARGLRAVAGGGR